MYRQEDNEMYICKAHDLLKSSTHIKLMSLSAGMITCLP
jgi:hypothetical protein